MNMTSPGKKLRELINAPQILAMPGIFDGYSAHLVEQFGFPAGFITGAGVSESHLGQPDVGLMGMEENLRVSRAIVGCCHLPLITDGDTGYGNAVNVYYMTRSFEQAGLGGLMIEDQVWPKRCGHMKGKQVISAEEMVEKIKAAAEARRDPDFVIKSRTDAYAPYGLKEAIRRLNLYAEAGADLLFADALLKEEDIATAARNVSKPLSVNMGFGIRSRPTTPLIAAKRLEDLGVAAVIYPRLLTSCAVQGMINGLEALQKSLATGEIVERPELAVSFEKLNDVLGFKQFEALEQRFLTKEQLQAKYG
jgi:2-methylisocitrate lyase-like PEP mutase family enzyme